MSGKRFQKYLVLRRDGARPPWPYFVLGGADPAATAALHAYCVQAAELGMRQQYIADVGAVVDSFREYQAEHGLGDPGTTSMIHDDPETLTRMGEETPLAGVRVNSTVDNCVIDVDGALQPAFYTVPGATVIDAEGKVVFRGRLHVANLDGYTIQRMSARARAQMASQNARRAVGHHKINILVPMGGLTKLVFANHDFVLLESGFGVRQLAEVLGVSPMDMGGEEIACWSDEHNIMQGFIPWQEWLAAGGEDIPLDESRETEIPDV